MEIIIRKTEEKDFSQTEYLTREAFWNIYKPGCDEHLVLNLIRKSDCYISELDCVALYNNEIIGHIISTKAKVVNSAGTEHSVLCVGPISVSPLLQNKGIGSKLINHSILIATELGYKGMILFGNPGYYHRFGFKNAKEFGITTKDLQNFDPFMALELMDKSLANISGRFFEDEVYYVNPDLLVEFDKQFPYKQKLKTSTQLQ